MTTISKLVIIRGNSGSGKSTVAREVQQKLGYGTVLIQQDVVRRETLKIKGDPPANPSVKLISDIALYGKNLGETVIIEGILQNSTHQKVLKKLAKQFDRVLTYYFDISFEETLRRHASKPNTHEFGEEKIREWWREKDYLDIDGEVKIPDSMNELDVVAMIYSDIQQS